MTGNVYYELSMLDNKVYDGHKKKPLKLRMCSGSSINLPWPPSHSTLVRAPSLLPRGSGRPGEETPSPDHHCTVALTAVQSYGEELSFLR